MSENTTVVSYHNLKQTTGILSAFSLPRLFYPGGGCELWTLKLNMLNIVMIMLPDI